MNGLLSSIETGDILSQKKTLTAALVFQKLGQVSVVLDTTMVSRETYTESLLYLIYWHHRSKNNKARREARLNDIASYLQIEAYSSSLQDLLFDEEIRKSAQEYVKYVLRPKPTVDLVILRQNGDTEQVLTLSREYYPLGQALPGALIRDEDEANEYDIPVSIFASLRAVSEKVFKSDDADYGISETDSGEKYYYVRGYQGSDVFEARIGFQNTNSFTYTDRLSHISMPSDPRHMVHTTAYKIDIVSGNTNDYIWMDVNDCIEDSKEGGQLVFDHHRKLVSHISAQSKDIPETQSGHHEYIRSIVADPKTKFLELKERFESNNNNPETSVPELFPVIQTIRSWLTNEATENCIKENPSIGTMRDHLIYKFHHITLTNGAFCPYATSIRLIFEAVAFFDVCRRSEKNFSTHFQKKYWHHCNDLISKIPDIILIPTPENISATDLMRIRTMPLYFIGISQDPIYVDEFWQSPLEFLIHDLNHAWKMRMADEGMMNMEDAPKNIHNLYEKAHAFGQGYLDSIKIQKTDSKEQKEIKKLKKIILFEIIHEDARPFLPQVLTGAILESEGYKLEDEEITYVEGKAIRVKNIYNGITALSYVRHKLQHGFFDQTDAQNIQIVDLEYRSVDWIVRAAMEILSELQANITEEIQEEGLEKFLKRQTTSRGPDILQEGNGLDPAVKKFGDGAYVDRE